MQPHIKGHAPLTSVHQFRSIKYQLDLFHAHVFRYQYKPRNYDLRIILWLKSPHLHLQVNIMDATHYWPFAQEYSIWNATVAALQFWTADPEPCILSNAIEWVYKAFFYSNSAQQLDSARRNTLWSLHGHLKHSYSSQKSAVNIPCLNDGRSTIQSCNSTHHSWTSASTLTTKIQMPQSCMLPFGI